MLDASRSDRTEGPAPAPDDRIFRRLLDMLPAGAYTCDASGLITWYNRRAVEIWGRAPALNDPADRFCGSSRLFTPDGEPVDRERCWMALALMLNRSFDARDVVIERPNGERVTVLAHANPIHDDAGNVVGAVNLLVDITDRRREEDERSRLEAQVLHAQKLESLGVLAGGIAHDFNNLLTAVLGNTSLALMSIPAESPTRPMLRAVEEAARDAAHLARQMLALSGEGHFAFDMLRLDAIVAETTGLLHALVTDPSKLVLHLSPATAEGDSRQVRQVLMSLVANAADAVGGQGGTVEVRTGTLRGSEVPKGVLSLPGDLVPGDYAFIEVKDSGGGMSEGTLAKIFDPLFTTKPSRRGLGLAAALGIARSHRGAITVTSIPGEGSTFRLMLRSAEEPSALQRPPRDAEPGAARQGHVLVVDDSETVRTVTQRALETAGFEVLLASDGIEAIELFQARSADVAAILLDLTMPRMHGLEAFKRLRAIRPGIPILVMSGYGEDEVSARFAGLNATGFVQKPFRAQDVIARLTQVVPLLPRE